MSFAESVAWSERVRDPNNGHTWTLMGDQTGGLLVRCCNVGCALYMTTQTLRQACDNPHADFEPYPDLPR